MYNLGPVIDARRAALRLSITELARRAGVSRQTLRTWRSSTMQPRQDHMSALAAALEMSTRDLLVQALPASSDPG
jgi:transcriptional regulator with XRE-family HTH domain